ncbi:hypothetical protein DID76_04235 [Candidatus Marinamargulisbacteria bacterium SCGC AG-414-C22]|nr:hypothetical protein DID76_04235 [Candidatus Marinamargulisbacteria bacterium SCGC AG-414-C22]
MNIIVFLIPLFIGTLCIIGSTIIQKKYHDYDSDTNIQTVYQSIHESSLFFLSKQKKSLISISILIVLLLSLKKLFLLHLGIDKHLFQSILIFVLTFLLGMSLPWFLGFRITKKTTNHIGQLINSLSQKNLNTQQLKHLCQSGMMHNIGYALIHLTIIFTIVEFIYSKHFFNIFHSLDIPFSLIFQSENLLAPSYLYITLICLGFCAGTSIQAIFSSVGNSIFNKTNKISSELITELNHDIPKDSLSNPAIMANYVGTQVQNGFNYSINIYETLIYNIIILTLFISGNIFYGEEPFNPYYLFAPFLLSSIGILISTVVCHLTNHSTLFNKATFIKNNLLSTFIFGITTWVFIPLNIINVHNFFSIWLGLTLGIIIMLNNFWQQHTKGPQKQNLEETQSNILSGLSTGFSQGIFSSIIPTLSTISCISICYMFSGGSVNIWPVLSNIGWVLIGFSATSFTKYMIGYARGSTKIALSIAIFTKGSEKLKTKLIDIKHLSTMSQLNSKVDTLISAVLIATILIVIYLDSIWWWIFEKSYSTVHYIGKVGFTTVDSLVDKTKNIHMIIDMPYRELLSLFYVDVLNPEIMIGLLIGASIPFLFMGIILKAITSGIKKVSKNISNQISENSDILANKHIPNYHEPLNISLKNTMKWLVTPGLIIFITPKLAALLFGISGSIGIIAGSLVSSFILGIQLIYSGNIWQLTQQSITDVKQDTDSSSHISASVNNAFGTMIKDSVGSSFNILIKLLILILILSSYLAIIGENFIK